MDLSSPLAVITPTLDGPVLAVLARSSHPLSGREVHRLAGEGSVGGVHKVLQRLVRQGIVRAELRPAETLYQLNRGHLAWEGIESIVRAPERLIEFLRRTLRSWRPAPRHASLFGSFVRGEAREGSDIDLLLIRAGRATASWERQVADLPGQIQAMTGNTANALEWSLSELRAQRGTPLVRELVAESVLLTGRPLDELVKAWR